MNVSPLLTRKASILFTATILQSPLVLAEVPSYSITEIGLYGDGYTSLSGQSLSSAYFLNASGYVAGYSERYSAANDTSLGQSGWLYNGADTVQVGLLGTGYTRGDGYAYTSVVGLNNSGNVAGNSHIYDATSGAWNGWAAWANDGTNTYRLGLTGEPYVAADGYQASLTIALTESGHVVGQTTRFNGPISNNVNHGYNGNDLWVYDGDSTVQIGLYGSGYTAANGRVNHSVVRVGNKYLITQQGHVAGESVRYLTGSGRDAWVFNGADTVQVGLINADHMTSTGQRDSRVKLLNEVGQAAGVSSRYTVSGSGNGQSSWYYDGINTVQIGLTGGVYAGSSGYAFSSVGAINESGWVSGSSSRYDHDGSNLNVPQDAWYYDGANTVYMDVSGVTGSRNDVVSATHKMSNSGFIVGSSYYIENSSEQGRDWLWIYKDGNAVAVDTHEISISTQTYSEYNFLLNESGQLAFERKPTWENSGSVYFYDGVSTSAIEGEFASGFTAHSGMTDLNEQGQLIGYSSHAALGDGTIIGTSAWLFDSESDQLFTFTIDSSADGEHFSEATYLGEDGLVLGSYMSYDDNGVAEGLRAFYFQMDDGLFDLGELVIDLDSEAWEFLSDVIRANGVGYIIGSGRMGNTISSYVLSPVPVPAAAWFMGSSLLVLLGARRRHKRFGQRLS